MVLEPPPSPLPSSKSHEKRQRRIVNWLDLPDHLYSLISHSIAHISDFIRFGATCHSFHSIYLRNRHHLPPKQPTLLLPIELNNQDDTKVSFYSLTENNIYTFTLPPLHNRYFAASSQGWLLAIHDFTNVTLLNPFASPHDDDDDDDDDDELIFPSITTFEPDIGFDCTDSFYGIITRFVLSANPSTSGSYAAMTIYGRFHRLAFFLSGGHQEFVDQHAWTRCGSLC